MTWRWLLLLLAIAAACACTRVVVLTRPANDAGPDVGRLPDAHLPPDGGHPDAITFDAGVAPD